MSNQKPNIKDLFNPSSIAIIGASHNKNKLGYTIVDNIVFGGYEGKIYPVNPKGGTILNYKVYKNILAISEESIDVALIVVPADSVYEVVQRCAQKKVKFLVIITSGFSEIGNKEEEKKIVKFAKANNMRVLGPNIFGIYSKAVNLNATFGPKNIKAGHVAMLTQSGAIGIGMIGKTDLANLGLSTIISIGNKTDIDEAELIEYLIADEESKIIMIYMEGVKEGQNLVKLLKKATAKKPVIIIKSGSSQRGAMATESHTGSLAGEDAVFDDIMKQAGVLRAESIKEALFWAKFLVEAPLAKGDNAVIITNGGGLGVMATDACEKFKVDLYDDQAKMATIYKNSVSSFGSTKNPIDLTGQATAVDYQNSIDASLKAKNINAVIGLYCETAVFAGNELPMVIKEEFKKAKLAGKPIVFSLFGGKAVEGFTKELNLENVSAFNDVYEAISAMGAMYKYKKYLDQNKKDKMVKKTIDIEKINKIVKKAKADNRYFLLADEAAEVMRAADIRMPQNVIVKTEKEAVKAAKKINFPVVMKIVSKDIIHKSDAGGILIGLKDAKEVKKGFATILANCKKVCPDAKIAGIEVVEMVKKGFETIIGARKDASFGPIVMFGLGGVYVEVLKDVSFRAVPLTLNQANGMLSSIKAAKLLDGVRGEKPKDKKEIVEVILKIAAIIDNIDLITDIEINPLIVYDKNNGAMAVDARILLKK